VNTKEYAPASVIIPQLHLSSQIQMVSGHLEKYFDVPAFAVNSDIFSSGKAMSVESIAYHLSRSDYAQR
jgi:hypothetical protein